MQEHLSGPAADNTPRPTEAVWSQLACPACSGPLEEIGRGQVGQARLVCRHERIEYGVVDGIPRLMAGNGSEGEAVIGSQFLDWWARAGPMYPRQRARAHRRLADLAGPGRGRVACDVGAGTTALAHTLAGKGWKVFALDLYAPQGEPVVDPDRVLPVVGSMMRPPFLDASLDLVTFSSSLQYVPDPGAAFAAWRRKIKPGGMILCALTPVHKTPTGARRAEAHARAMVRKTAATDELASAYHHFTRTQLVAAFQGAGLEVEFLPVPFTRGFRLVRFLKGLIVGPDLARFPMMRARAGLMR